MMMPLIALDLIHSIEILGNTIGALDNRCIAGIEAVPERCEAYAEGSLALVTALNTHLPGGYLTATAITEKLLETGKSLRQIVLG